MSNKRLLVWTLVLALAVWIPVAAHAQLAEWGIWQQDRSVEWNPRSISYEGKPVIVRVSQVPDWSDWDRIVAVVSFPRGRNAAPVFVETTGEEYMSVLSENLFPGVLSMTHVLVLWGSNNRGAADFTVDAFPFNRVDERYIFSREEADANRYTMLFELRGMNITRYEDVYEDDRWIRRPVYGPYEVLTRTSPVEVVTTRDVPPLPSAAPSLDNALDGLNFGN